MSYRTTAVRAPDAPKSATAMTVTSETFAESGALALEQAHGDCGGSNRAPQLAWRGAPEGTKSFAITCFDPDAPTGSGYWHWLLFDVPGSTTQLALGDATPGGSTTGRNDYGASEYGGPCPPPNDGAHRYIFTVYALDVPKLEGLGTGVTGASLVFTMRGHVLATGTLTGTYGR